MHSTNQGTTPGLRRAGEPVIRTAWDGAVGLQSRAMLEGILGTCAGSTIDGPVWASLRGDKTGARLFSAPADFMNKLGGFSTVLADGVTARVIYVEAADCEMAGPGAKFLMATRGMGGLRQAASAFPLLPENWLAAIEATQRNGRFLRVGAAAEATQRSLPPVAAPKPAVSSPAPSSSPRAASKAPRLDARELARRSAIVAKYGISTPRGRALVNEKIVQVGPTTTEIENNPRGRHSGRQSSSTAHTGVKPHGSQAPQTANRGSREPRR